MPTLIVLTSLVSQVVSEATVGAASGLSAAKAAGAAVVAAAATAGGPSETAAGHCESDEACSRS